MILEHCDIQIDPSKQVEFNEAIIRGLETTISKSKGFRGYKVNHCIESPSRYLLLIYWETLENHMVDFRESPLFGEWRAIVGPFFTKPPFVEHFEFIGKSA